MQTASQMQRLQGQGSLADQVADEAEEIECIRHFSQDFGVLTKRVPGNEAVSFPMVRLLSNVIENNVLCSSRSACQSQTCYQPGNVSSAEPGMCRQLKQDCLPNSVQTSWNESCLSLCGRGASQHGSRHMSIEAAVKGADHAATGIRTCAGTFA